MLKVTDLHVHYGAIHALKGISFNLNEGEIVALIGANGAGKSTLLNTISGILEASQGTVEYQEEVISNTPPQEIVKKGVIQVPEGRKIFAKMSVTENLEMGAFIKKDKRQVQYQIDSLLERFPLIKDRRNQLGGTLSGGEQQMLAIARGLMADPKLMLLDEPSMGLAPVLVEQVFDVIEDNRAYVLETGRIVLEGNAMDVLNNSMVIEAYLGGKKK